MFGERLLYVIEFKILFESFHVIDRTLLRTEITPRQDDYFSYRYKNRLGIGFRRDCRNLSLFLMIPPEDLVFHIIHNRYKNGE